MSHIVIYACDIRRNIQTLNLTADFDFKPDYLKDEKRVERLGEELHADLLKVIEKYFDKNYESTCSLTIL